MTQLTIDRVRALIDAYGGDPGRWPDDEREPALILIARHPDLARELEDARKLDTMLNGVPAPAPSPAMRVRLKQIPSDRGSLGRFFGVFDIWRPAAGLAAVGVLGIALGVGLPETPLQDRVDADLTAAVATGDTVSVVAAGALGIAETDLLQ